MKKAVMYGAGNIGRGFIGQLLFQSGYNTVFIDINTSIINAFNQDREYPIRIVSNESKSDILIKNVSGLNGITDADSVAAEIAQCDIMCTAVGVNVLPNIVPNLAEGIKRRSKTGRELNIIICENMIGADTYLKQKVKEYLPEQYHEFVDKKVGFVEASVGRMVPVVTEEMREGNILRVWVEPYCRLPVDKEAFKGIIPKIDGMLPESNFEYYIQSKLFLHNMGHCLTAYLGKLNGYTYIHESISNETIKDIVQKAMYTSAEVLSAEHNRTYTEVKRYAGDLIFRFGNRYLNDTVERVGRDLKRKLSENDRFMGAIRLCEKYDVDATYIRIGVASALLFGEEYDIKELKLKEAKLR